MGPSFSLDIVNLATSETRSVFVNAGWTDESADVYRRWCDCGAAGYFNRGRIGDNGEFIDFTEERHELRAREYINSHGCDHSGLTRFKFVRAKLQDGRIVDIAFTVPKQGVTND